MTLLNDCWRMAPASCLITPVNNQPLSGRTIVITRALAQADEFAQELERYGGAGSYLSHH